MSAAPLRLALFDCDGTLVDSQHAIVAAMTVAWASYRLPAPRPEMVRAVVGLSLVDAIARLLPDAPPDIHMALSEAYKEAFLDARQSREPDPLYPGTLEALDRIEEAGVLLGIATGKSRRGLDATLDAHGLVGRFVTLQTADLGPGKPHPAMVTRALAETGAEAAGTVVIGDTTYDIEMARAAKAHSIGVVWGYHAPERLAAAGAGRLVDDYAAVPGAVLDMLEA